ncbi:MAG: kelch repeat-containing protein [Bacteroidales bacterium]|nr:kelch repeat-containing protein [Bacteroidales bacterium]
MKKKFTSIVLILLYFTNFAQNTWEQITPTGDIPTARQGHSMVTIDSLIYLFGGADNNKTFGIEAENFIAVSDNTRVVKTVKTGRSSFDTIHTYDSSFMEWSEEEPSNTPPPARHGHKAIVKDGKMYVFFGKGNSSALDDIWQYNPATKEWTQIIPSSTTNPVARYDHTATLVGNMVWIMGGLDNSENLLNALWASNFTSNIWEHYPSLTETELNGHTAATYNGKLDFFGGFGGGFMNSTIYEFSPGSGNWAEYSPQGDPLGPFAYGSSVQYGPNTVFIFSGKVGTNISIQDCFLWDLTNHTFTQLANGPDVANAAAALCPNGFYDKSNYEEFVVFGGAADGTLVDSTWIYTSNIETPSGINESEPTDITIFPNPAQDFITIEISDENLQSQELNYQLCDITGRIIVSNKISTTKELIDVSGEAAGMYFIRICNGNKIIEIIKTIKE